MQTAHHTFIPWGKIQSLSIKAGGTYIEHWTLTVKYFIMMNVKVILKAKF
jgi:hypothetical protein